VIRHPYVVAGSLCGGLALSVLLRAALLPAVALVVAALVLRPPLLLAALLLVVGWWWGSVRVQALDRSVLAPRAGPAERALVETLEPARTTRYAVRVRALVLRWGELRPHEPVLLELPLGRAPPQGAKLRVLGTLRPPGDAERGWLRLHGVHVVLRAGTSHLVGSRGSVADRLHAWLARASVPGLAGERRAVLEGVVLGEDQGLTETLRDRFRASGLYHLLAVSGGNVIVVASGAAFVAIALGAGRLLAESCALLAIVAYVLAVGPQPSVIRAGIAGGLGCLAWLTGRERDRVYALLVGAVVLLAWSPLNVLDAGFQLSFDAVGAIFVLAPRLDRWLEGYLLPKRAREATALSTACGVCTAPISWAHFHQIPLLTVPANVAAAPVVAPMLALSLLAAVLPPFGPALAQANGLLAAYLAGCARLFGGLPGAQVRSAAGAAALAAGALLAAAYAWPRGERAEAGLPPDGKRPAEDRARGAPVA
jgi:competence protein ComEC